MLGYFSNNRIDIKYLAGADGSGLDSTAEVITNVVKNIGEENQLSYVDTEVFMDGIMTGRGFFNHRMCYDSNDFGDLKVGAQDPFSTYLDPDAQQYDLNDGCGYICTARMGCLDEIESLYGKMVRQMLEPFASGRTPIAQFYVNGVNEEISPIRRFGHSENSESEWWDTIYNQLGAFYDPLRKSLRIMDFQHQMYREGLQFVDLDSGDRTDVPEDWQSDRIKKVLWWAEQNGAQLFVDRRMIKKVRWTTVIGDLIVQDRWSPYKTYSLVGYFPYFRRGVTRGMVEDLLDPNMEINKRRSARVDTISRTAHSGWKYHVNSLTAPNKAKLLTHGSEAGYNMEWQGTADMEPKKIEPSASPAGLREAERDATDDMLEVSGINESALGQIDIGQSGRAIEARQRQAVIAVQTYLTNFSRSKELQGRKFLECVQGHYTEQRFHFLGFTFRPRSSRNRQGKLFTSFAPP